MFWYKQFYVCALDGVLIKCHYEMRSATIKTFKITSGEMHCHAVMIHIY